MLDLLLERLEQYQNTPLNPYLKLFNVTIARVRLLFTEEEILCHLIDFFNMRTSKNPHGGNPLIQHLLQIPQGTLKVSEIGFIEKLLANEIKPGEPLTYVDMLRVAQALVMGPRVYEDNYTHDNRY